MCLFDLCWQYCDKDKVVSTSLLYTSENKLHKAMNLPFSHQSISFARNNPSIQRVLPNPSNSNEALIFTSNHLKTTFCYNIISNQYKTYTLKNWPHVLNEYQSQYPHLNLSDFSEMTKSVEFDATIGVYKDTRRNIKALIV